MILFAYRDHRADYCACYLRLDAAAEFLALLVAIALLLIEIGLGFKALASPGGTINGVPSFRLFFLATVTALAGGGDVRLMRSAALSAAARLARHLWRMCFALFIATS